MKDVEYWNVFEQTGSVVAYLQYACACEREITEELEEQEIFEEGEPKDESGKYYGNGTDCYASGGL